ADLKTTPRRAGVIRAQAGYHGFLLPQFSSSSRFTAGASAFFILSQSGERPDRYSESFRFVTIPFKAELARVPKHGLAVAVHVLVELHASAGVRLDYLSRGLAALKRMTAASVAVKVCQ